MSTLTCSTCGTGNALGARFCARCGAALTRMPAGACDRCGAVLPPEGRFCESCGAPVGSVPGRRPPAKGISVRGRPVLWLAATAILVGLVLAAQYGLPGLRPPALRPDSIVLASIAGEKRGIYVVRSDGSGLTRLTNEFDSSPVWLSDGRHVAFVRSAEGRPSIYVMDSDGGGQRPVPGLPRERHPVWSRSSKSVLLTDGIWEIYEVSASGSSARLVARFAKPVQSIVVPWHLTWAPDDRLVAFSTSGQMQGLFKMNADGSGLVRLRNSGWDPEWSPDGNRLAFIELGTGEIHLIDADGGKPLRLTDLAAESASPPAWSPDGKRIAFTAFRGGVFVVNADGSGLRQLVMEPFAIDPVWSPDGRQLAFWASRPTGATVETLLYVVHSDGSGQVRLASFGPGEGPPTRFSGPSWQPR